MRYETAIPNDYLTKEQIIKKLAQERQIEKWIENIRKTGIHLKALEDFAQDMYLFIMEMEKEKIEQLYESGQLPFFINRVLLNQLNSRTSQFYSTYIKPQQHAEITESGKIR